MNRDSLLGGLRALGGGLLRGIVVVILIVVVLVLIANLATAEDIETEPYHTHTEAQIVQLTTLLTEYEAAIEIDLSSIDPPDCERSNEYTQYMLDRMQDEIKLHPELAYIYQPTIDLLNASWCIE